MFLTIQVTKSNGVVAKEMQDYATIEEAKEHHHDFMKYHYNASVLATLDYFMGEIVDEDGIPVVREPWFKPAPVVRVPQDEPQEIPQEQ